MSLPTDPLAHLESLANKFKEQEGQLRDSLRTMEHKLKTVCEGAQVYCSSNNRVLAQYGPDDYYRGHFSFDGKTLSIAYRSTDDDMIYYYDPDSDEGPTYSVKSLDECPIEWLRSLLKTKALDEILPQIGEQLADQLSATKLAADAIDSISANPTSAIKSGFVKSAVALGYDEVLRVWKEAQSAVITNPDAAITKASSLIESVCKHIIHDVGAQLPTNQDIQGLYKVASKCLKLDPGSQADADLRGLCGGLNTVTNSVGSLRTHFGDAHGRGPEQKALAAAHAQLSVSAAGAVSTFLMERWLGTKPTVPAANQPQT